MPIVVNTTPRPLHWRPFFMIEHYATGLNGFIGKRLKNYLPDTVNIPHEDIAITHLQKFKYFYFLSSYGNMADQKDELVTIQANLTDPVDVVARSIEYPYKSFVFFSSSSVGLPTQTLYSRCKAATEQVLLGISEAAGKSICIIRPFSVTGVGEQKRHLIPTLIRSCLTEEKMCFTPTPVHDFIDVDDLVNGVINLSMNQVRGVYELGTGQGYSNQQVLELVEDVTGKKANVDYVGCLRRYDTTDWICRSYKARSFGWEPRKTLRQSVEEMVNEFKKKHE